MAPQQARGTSYTQIVYAPTGGKLALMNGQSTLVKGFAALPGQATAVYTSSGLDHYRHSDWLGSARLTSSLSRAYISSVAYAPFGETYAQSGTADLSFTGQNQDTVSGDFDFLYREYSTQGRWISPDPAGLAAVDATAPQSWNRYGYVVNNALQLIDPRGTTVCDEQGNNCYDSVTVYPDSFFSGGSGGWRGPTWRIVDAASPDGGPSLWTVSKNLNRCAAQLSQTKSLSALTKNTKLPIPEVLGSNFFGDISSLATGSGGLDQGAGIATEGTIQIAEHAAAQVAIGTVTTISKPISATAGVYNPVAVGTASQSLGGTIVGRAGLGLLKLATIGKLVWDGAMYLAAEAACAGWTY